MPIARRSAFRQAPFAPLPFGLSLRTVRFVPLGHSVRYDAVVRFTMVRGYASCLAWFSYDPLTKTLVQELSL